MICLGKPIIMVRAPGMTIPRALERVVDAWIDVDWDAPDHRQIIAEQMGQIMKDLEAKGILK